MGNSINPSENGESPTVLLRRLHHWRMAFLGMVILLAGMLSGAAASLLLVGHVGQRRPRPPVVEVVTEWLARLSGPLHLTAEQQKQVEPILQKHKAKLDQIQEEGRKTIAEELRLMSEEMAGVLTDDQMHLWERLFLDLPGSVRHIPQELGPGFGRRAAPGPGGRRGPPADRGGPPHMSTRSPVPDADAVQHK